MSGIAKPSGHIRSFVRRQGRLTGSQQHALSHYWSDYGLAYTPEGVNLDDIFGRHAPRVLDIGTGTGAQTIALAESHPENDYLAVEVHAPGIGALLREIEHRKLTNVRIINHDVMDVLRDCLPANSLDLVYLFFPDPWPKKRHHKRRLVNPLFLEQLKNRMKRHARLFIATDWQDYADHIFSVFNQVKGFTNLAAPGKVVPRPHWRITTRFENRGKALQHPIHDFVFGLDY